MTVAYNQAKATRGLVDSFIGDWAREIHLFLHSRRPEVVATCEEMAQSPDIVYYPYGNNPGLARSWNEGIRRSRGDYVFVANNDIEFVPGAVDEMVRMAEMHPEKYIITCGHGYSAFLLQPIALQVVGWFDEALKPAYYEDCDYAWRAHLAGLHSVDLPDLGVKHVGNGTIKNERRSYRKRYRRDMARLRAYYRRKWGGGPLMEPDREIYDKPFNGEGNESH